MGNLALALGHGKSRWNGGPTSKGGKGSLQHEGALFFLEDSQEE